MPRSSPSTKATVETATVEVVELDRQAIPSPPSRSSGRGFWWLGGLAATIGLVSFLPTGEEPVDTSNATIPNPVVATTVPPQGRAELAYISPDRFLTQRTSGLDGFRQLSNTVEFAGVWWLVAQETDPAPTASLMLSVDGTEWEVASTITAAPGLNLDIDRLALIGEALVALGTEGVPIGPDFFRSVEGDIKLWRSARDLWVPEVVAPAETGRTFQHLGLATSGDILLVQAESHHLRPFELANQFDPTLHEPIRAGTFVLYAGTELAVWSKGGFRLLEVPLPSDPDLDTSRIFRSSSFGEWEEVDFNLDYIGPVVRAPEGGFMVTSNQGVAYTSAFGTSWKRNPRSDIGFYQSDDQRTLVRDLNGDMTVVDSGLEERFKLPYELTKCVLHPAAVIAAVCPIGSPPVMSVKWEGMEITSQHRGHLDLADPATGSKRTFNPLGENRYLADTDELVLTDTEGVEQAFPVTVLDQLDRAYDYSLFLSRTGLEWERVQEEIVAPSIRSVGAVADGFLFAVSSGPFDPLTTIIGRLHN